MSYLILDSNLKSWADKHSLNIHTQYQDCEARSIDIVSPEEKRFQLWVDEPDTSGNTVVHIWDMKTKKKNYSVLENNLEDSLELAYKQAKSWF